MTSTQGEASTSLAGARPFSSSDAHADESRRRISPKPSAQASPSSSPPRLPPGELVSVPSSSALIPLPPGLDQPPLPLYSITPDMHSRMLYDSQAVAHLLQQDVTAASTIRNMEIAFSSLRAEHMQADEARRQHDAHTQHVIQVGIAQIQATHDRLLATENAADIAAQTAARHIQQLMSEAAALRQHALETTERLDLTQSAVQSAHTSTDARITATQAAVLRNAQSARQDDHSLATATLEGFASVQDRAAAYSKAAELKRVADAHVSDTNAQAAYTAQATLLRRLEDSDARRQAETASALHA